ncbi:hypothetical protein N9276_00610 [Rhodopirellula sp.]|nr:hypothetical protein [Rhodopirellula sp.]
MNNIRDFATPHVVQVSMFYRSGEVMQIDHLGFVCLRGDDRIVFCSSGCIDDAEQQQRLHRCINRVIDGK